MTGDDFKSVIEFENGLSVGDDVRIKWTNSNKFWNGSGKLKKINRQSFVVTLSEPVGGPRNGELWHGGEGEYPAGHAIKVPRLSNGSGAKLWSIKNRVEPADGYDKSDDDAAKLVKISQDNP